MQKFKNTISASKIKMNKKKNYNVKIVHTALAGNHLFPTSRLSDSLLPTTSAPGETIDLICTHIHLHRNTNSQLKINLKTNIFRQLF